MFTEGEQSVVEFQAVAGVDYFIIVVGFGAVGDYYLSAAYGRCADVRPVTCNAEFPCVDERNAKRKMYSAL